MRGAYNYDTRGASAISQLLAAPARLEAGDKLKGNRAHVGVFKKGARAYVDGKLLKDCPYQDKRKPSGRLSWSRGFIAAWKDGWYFARKILTGAEEPNR